MAKAKEELQCCENVWDSSRFRPCDNNGKIQRDGKWYCGVHDPVAVAEKSKARDEKLEAKWAEENRHRREKKQLELRRQLATRNLLSVCQQLREWEDSNLVESDSLSLLLADLRMSAYEFEQANEGDAK